MLLWFESFWNRLSHNIEIARYCKSMPSLEMRLSKGPAAATSTSFELPSHGSIPLSDIWAGPTFADEPAFASFLADLVQAALGGEVLLEFPPYKTPHISTPGVWNLTGDAAFAAEFPLSWNYLNPRSPNYELKRFQRRLYLERLAPWLEHLPKGTSILDLGGGIGRFSEAWMQRGWNVTLADPNNHALLLALSHLISTGGRFNIYHLAAEDISPLPDEHFHAVSAMEVFCYLSEPRTGIAEAARVLRPGGWLFASVESPIGALEPHIRHSREAINQALTHDHRAIENDMWVRYFTPDSLRAEVESVGLEVEAVIGTHYLPDGPMHHLVDVERLGESGYETALIELERLLQDSQQWQDAARAWVVVARKPQ